ncbi:MAG: OmpA family protein [Myxococcota bacterium]|jgi:outer membrane protein OmpA-like peptidoglycan-associated protein|nr:OmpA family protein [Myxococcota bacterium]
MPSSSSKLVWALVVLAIGTANSACVTDPYTGERKFSKGALGAIFGAGIGAAIGAATGDNGRERKKRALIGAGVGALGGGAVGVYMDQQERKLREQLEGTGVGVTREGDDVILNMPGNVTFATDSDEFNTSFNAVLDSVALVLNEYDQTLVEVSGHTDSTGDDEYNLELSGRRAESVANYLLDREVAHDRFVVLKSGEREPTADNATPEGRERNRRVEITLVPVTDQGGQSV